MKAIITHSDISMDYLLNTLDDINHDGSLSDEEIGNTASTIINKVNSLLHGSLVWQPETSEILSDGDDIDIDTVREMISTTISDTFGF